MEHFADASSYCQHLKSLSDQLSNVGSPVTNERLVLQLVSGLTDAYASVGSQICHGDSLPPFYKAQSMLVLEETTRTKKVAQTSSNSAFFVSPVAHSSGHTAGNPYHHRPNHTSYRSSTTRNSSGGGSGARSSKGRGRGVGRGGQFTNNSTLHPGSQCPHSSRNGLFLLGLGRGNLGLRPHAHTQRQTTCLTSPALNVRQAFLGPGHNRPTWQPLHRRPSHLMLQSTFKQLCIHSQLLLLLINGTWTPEPHLT